MNYQEIYKGLNKKASAEQVKELAGMIKKAQLKKEALAIPGLNTLFSKFSPGALKELGGKAVQGIAKMKPVTATYQFVKKHPRGVLETGGALGALGGGLAIGSAGKPELKGALDRANEASTKLVEENKKLKAGSGSLWEDILKALGQWWNRISKSWNAGTEKTPATPAPAATEAVKK